ncbi:dethiobiotin synthase [Denitratisoma sp. DHT3]|uniref:dethiobiotin synthase n=1 Tax=Denitratisoma sp. DHT3 TaxID=1981880 RepID=UPI00119892D8|nr:dethiobiotin synthase [Denitratisoma sp. DHT3]QDX80336.1 dethiobiotin synthase [Denitratisoma sp. DHT3]
MTVLAADLSPGYFITGTDTEVGKTFATCALLRRLAVAGRRVAAMKPVAAGLDEHGRNEDVEALLAAANVRCARERVNPYAFASPIAPHLAAREEGREIRFAPILRAFAALAGEADGVLVEGVGGFRVPLGSDGDAADLAVALGLPVILVVGLRLGCINHALLTVEAVRARGLRLAGWIGNCATADMARREENVATLRELIAAPLLGVLPHLTPADPAAAAAFLDLPS